MLMKLTAGILRIAYALADQLYNLNYIFNQILFKNYNRQNLCICWPSQTSNVYLNLALPC